MAITRNGRTENTTTKRQNQSYLCCHKTYAAPNPAVLGHVDTLVKLSEAITALEKTVKTLDPAGDASAQDALAIQYAANLDALEKRVQATIALVPPPLPPRPLAAPPIAHAGLQQEIQALKAQSLAIQEMMADYLPPFPDPENPFRAHNRELQNLHRLIIELETAALDPAADARAQVRLAEQYTSDLSVLDSEVRAKILTATAAAALPLPPRPAHITRPDMEEKLNAVINESWRIYRAIKRSGHGYVNRGDPLNVPFERARQISDLAKDLKARLGLPVQPGDYAVEDDAADSYIADLEALNIAVQTHIADLGGPIPPSAAAPPPFPPLSGLAPPPAPRAPAAAPLPAAPPPLPPRPHAGTTRCARSNRYAGNVDDLKHIHKSTVKLEASLELFHRMLKQAEISAYYQKLVIDEQIEENK